jgi:radical SAM superfamily enzyme YgiQ (UPF0313 family)
MIMFGVESGDPGELAYIRKQCNVEDARRAIVLTKQAQIKARANFMLGFPISTHKSVRNTIEFAKSVPLDIVRFFSVTPLPNTELWDRIYGARADLGSLAWDKLDFYTATYRTAELTQEQIRSYVGAAYLYLLTKRAIRELTAGLMHRFIKLFYLCCQNKRIRGNLSLAFPAAVNLLLDMRAVMHAMKPAQKLRFMLQSLSLARSLAKGR